MRCPTCGHTSRTPRAAKLLTASSAGTFRLCPRKYSHSYVTGLRPRRTADALRLGTAWHAGMEQWWQRKQVALTGEMDFFELAKLNAMLAAYDARWASAREQYQVLGIEVPFRAPLLDGSGRVVRGWAIAGKIDGLLRSSDGAVLLLEHKTTSDDLTPGSDYWAQLTLDAQVSIYHDGAAALGHRVEACLYDVARKPQVKPGSVDVTDADGVEVVLDAQGQRVLKANGEPRRTGDSAKGYVVQRRPETPDEYQARCLAAIAERPEAYLAQAQVVRLAGELEAAREDLAGTARLIDGCARAGSWPRNPRACFELGRCAYHGLCSGTESAEAFETVQDVHPELQVKEAA